MSLLKSAIDGGKPFFVTLAFLAALTVALRIIPIATLISLPVAQQEEAIVISDAIHYHVFAQQIREHGLLSLYHEGVNRPDILALRLPLYPLIIRMLYGIFGAYPIAVLLFQILVEAGTVMLLTLFVRQLSGSTPAAALAGFLYAINQYVIVMTGALFAEVVFNIAFLAITIFWHTTTQHPTLRNHLLLGGALGLITLIKPIGFLLTFLLVSLLYIFQVRGNSYVKRLAYVLASVGVFCLMISPWQLRNYLLYHEYSLTYQQGTDLLLHRVSFLRSAIEREDIPTSRKVLSALVVDDPNYFVKAKHQQEVAISYISSHFSEFLQTHLRGMRHFFLPNVYTVCIPPTRTLTMPYLFMEQHGINQVTLIRFCMASNIATGLQHIAAFFFALFLLAKGRYRNMAIYTLACAFFFANMWGIASMDVRAIIPMIPLTLIMISCGTAVIAKHFLHRRAVHAARS